MSAPGNPNAVAVVGMACIYPDAGTPQELWENVLAQRVASRRMPPERLRVADYSPDAVDHEDSIYSGEAAVIEGYEFDRVRFRVSGETYRVTDMTHWLALDVASRALADAGFADAEGLPRETTGVIVGNTLTGEFTRAGLMRLRWPFVRRVVAAQLLAEGLGAQQSNELLAGLERRYKSPFPPPGEDSLAGGLSNTIAGRIANHFDLGGGGFTVDGACASSLIAVANACAAVTTGDLDVAVVGGVDLSLDPFELVGFARTGALARGEMRVFDAEPTGFIPGEGCGFVVAMRLQEALRQGLRIYAVIHGWGISSDGAGGLTRPEVQGQLLAVERAYRRAGFGIDSVGLFEGHGTGTRIGDATELEALNRARRKASGAATPGRAAIGSVKANIGHTKAAAGLAGLIKATMALHQGLLPPTSGCANPHPEIAGAHSTMRTLTRPAPWPVGQPCRVGVSSMGFGGINAHVVLEEAADRRHVSSIVVDNRMGAAPWDTELILLAAPDEAALARQVSDLRRIAGRMSRAEVADLSATLADAIEPLHRVRAAVIAATPAELADRLGAVASRLADGIRGDGILEARGTLLARAAAPPRVGILFPGQGSPTHPDGGLWRRRLAVVDELYAHPAPMADSDGDTATVQPALATACLAALRVLRLLGVDASVAVGHSLGELVALHWAGAMDEDDLLSLATARGRVMCNRGRQGGAMASIGAAPEGINGMVKDGLVIAGYNSPLQTVVSGDEHAVEGLLAAARAQGLAAVRLPISHAFHSPHMEPAAQEWRLVLEQHRFRAMLRTVCSTVTGGALSPGEDLAALLCRQLTSPVRFVSALRAAAAETDILLEAGPGEVLTGLAAATVSTPVLALDAGGPSLAGLLRAAGALFVLGAPVQLRSLLAARFLRPFDPRRELSFLANPCEQAPVADLSASEVRVQTTKQTRPDTSSSETLSPYELLRNLTAERAELPRSAVTERSSLLDDLHLSSITVSEIVAEAGRRLGLPPSAGATDYARATVGQAAEALQELLATRGELSAAAPPSLPAGVDSWVRAFTITEVERPQLATRSGDAGGRWKILAPPDHALRSGLQDKLGRSGVVLCLPPDTGLEHVEVMLEAARAALDRRGDGVFVVVQQGCSAAALARTLHLEAPEIPVVVVNLPPGYEADPERWIAVVAAEAAAVQSFTEVRHDRQGRRWQPVLRPLPPATSVGAFSLGAEDVVLASGGGKGITAECALALARPGGARLAIIGRSRPEDDAELRGNLERMRAAGVEVRYLAADVTDPGAVRGAVTCINNELGPVTALLHGAGANPPRLLAELERVDLETTLAPKVAGLENLLEAVSASSLELVITLGSVIARTGMRGEAHYALANSWLRARTERLADERPQCRCLCVEWSVWSGVGMGERLGRVEALNREGITAITPDAGIAALRDLLSRPWRAGQPEHPVSVVVAGRLGDPPTLEVEQPELPLLRFLERPRVFVPGVELIADADLSLDSDPYLADHVLDSEPLLPAVIGLEAMAQAAMTVSGRDELPVFRGVRFERPVIVAGEAGVTVRVAALVREGGEVDLALRCSTTAFQADHFSATAIFGDEHSLAAASGADGTTGGASGSDPLPAVVAGENVHLAPQDELYGRVLFQTGRFRRLQAYRRLHATGCQAEITPADGTGWFSRYLPGELRLGDPGARDAGVHSIQACLPHRTLLPVAVDRLVVGAGVDSAPRMVAARERSRNGNVLVWDLELRGADGSSCERWEGLQLRAVDSARGRPELAPALLGPYIERRLQELITDVVSPRVVVERSNRDRPVRRTVERVLEARTSLHHRPDGRPEVDAAAHVSVSHGKDLVMVVAGQRPVGCDAEPVAVRAAEVWADLLGRQRFDLVRLISEQRGEDVDAAATRVWAASECMKKVGATADSPLLLQETTRDGWVLLRAGASVVACVVMNAGSSLSRHAFAVLVTRD